MLRAHALVPSLAASLVACGATEPTMEPPTEPGAVVVRAAEGSRLCEGTRAWVDTEIDRVVALTSLPPRAELPVTLGLSTVEEHCTRGGDPLLVLGCTAGSGGRAVIHSTPEVFAHELVHGLRRHYDLRTVPMFEEGFAEMINGSAPYPRAVTLDPAQIPDVRWPEALIDLDATQFRSVESYRAAIHFVEFLRQEHGEPAVAAFMTSGIDDDGTDARERFAVHFDRTLDDAAQAWRDAAEQSLGRGELCPDGIEPAPAGAITLDFDLDCDAPHTFGLLGNGEAAWVRRCIEVPEGRYAVQLDAGEARIDPVLGTCDAQASPPATSAKAVAAGESGSLDFAACTWAVTLSTTRSEPHGATLVLTP